MRGAPSNMVPAAAYTVLYYLLVLRLVLFPILALLLIQRPQFVAEEVRTPTDLLTLTR